MSMSTPAANPAAVERDPEKVAQHVEFFYGRGGIQPGAWENNLLALIAHADPENRDLLAQVYPVHVEAMVRGHLANGSLL